jgi:hypothetical protein
MTTASDDPRAALRRGVYALLICVGAGAMLGRILAVDAVDRTATEDFSVEKRLNEKRQALKKAGVPERQWDAILAQERTRLHAALTQRRPFLSGNDRSRWDTIRALVEDDMRVPGAPYAIERVIQQPNWDTIDMVKHDGHLYSSKPPLLATLIAGEYWAIYRVTGMSLGTHPYEIGRFMLVTLNVIPLLIYFWLLARLVERLGTTDWGRIFVMAAAVFGTLLTTFAVVLNNHLPAAVCALAALYAALRIWFDGERRLRYFIIVGLLGALLVADELPAASLAVALGLAILWKAPRQTLLACAPAVLAVLAGFFGTNWIAHHSWRPPYAHRSTSDDNDNWYKYTFRRNGQEKQSYWENPQGIDRGEPSRAVYALHVLVGHHGIFSLTPVWLLSVAGTLVWLGQKGDRRLRELALLIGGISLVCVAFYIARPLQDRNYGGMACGFRWVLWLAPLWLLAMLPAADFMAGRRWTRGIALALLMVSVVSVCYPLWNPWSPPWLMDYMHYMQWIR